MTRVDGLRIVPSPLACRTVVQWGIRRVNPRARRRQWAPVRNERMEPCAFQVGDVLYVHPTIYEKLKD